MCKTCTDYGHACLGYNDPDKPTQATVKDEPAGGDDESVPRSPTTPRVAATMAPPPDSAKSPKPNKLAPALPLTKDTLTKATKENDKLGVDSPESSTYVEKQV